jgi:uncharacterized delta-60 repeat protein
MNRLFFLIVFLIPFVSSSQSSISVDSLQPENYRLFSLDHFSVSSISDLNISDQGKLLISGYGGYDYYFGRVNVEGQFDTSFLSMGYGNFDIERSLNTTIKSAVHANGKIFCAGDFKNRFEATYENQTQFFVLNPDGTLNYDNIEEGYVSYDFCEDNETVFDLALDNNENSFLLVQTDSDTSNYENPDVTLVKLDQSGNLDFSFGDNGQLKLDFDTDIPAKLIIQPDGKILFSGYTRVGTSSPYTYKGWIIRLLPNGGFDSDFGNEGVVFHQPFDETMIFDMILQTDNKILVCGKSNAAAYDNHMISRYNTDGSLDNTFASNGTYFKSVSSYNDHAYAITRDEDGHLYSVNYTMLSGGKIQLLKLDSLGSLVQEFANNGILWLDNFNYGSVHGTNMKYLEGKLYLTCRDKRESYSGLPCLIKVDTSGNLDTTFIDTDRVLIYEPDFYQSITNMDLCEDGSVLAIGDSYFDYYNRKRIAFKVKSTGVLDSSFCNNGFHINDTITSEFSYQRIREYDEESFIIMYSDGDKYILLKMKNDGSPDVTFADEGVLIDSFAYRSYGFDLQIKPNGEILVHGTVLLNNENYHAVSLYNQNGQRNVSFANYGIMTSQIESYYSSGSYGGLINDLLVDQDGSFIIFGDHPLKIQRYLENGFLDNTFLFDENTDSLFIYSNIGLIQQDGKIVLVGYPGWYGDQMHVVRFNQDGSRDLTFGDSSVFILEGLPWGCKPLRIMEDENHKLLVMFYLNDCGELEPCLNSRMIRLNIDGTIDSTFNSGDVMDFNSISYTSFNDFLLLPDERIVLGGDSYNDFCIANLSGDFSNDTLVSFKELFVESEYQLYPNPAGDWINIDYLNNNNCNQNGKIEIYNLHGVLVQVQWIDLKNVERIDISDISSGIYLVKLFDDNLNVLSKKLIKL